MINEKKHDKNAMKNSVNVDVKPILKAKKTSNNPVNLS